MATNNLVKDIMDDYTQKFIDALQDSLVKHDRFAKGTLFQAINARVKVFGQSINLEITLTNYGEIDEYWKVVDKGRRAGAKRPPQSAMLKHIADRGNRLNPIAISISKSYKNSKGIIKTRKKPLPMDKARKTLAFLIARNIGKKGLQPTNFASEVMHGNLIDLFREDIKKAVGRDIKIEIDKEIKE